MSSATAYVVIVSAVGAALVSIVNAVGSWWGRQDARVAAVAAIGKLDQIHELTNSNMTAIKVQLQIALARIEMLERMFLMHGLTVPLAPVTDTDAQR